MNTMTKRNTGGLSFTAVACLTLLMTPATFAGSPDSNPAADAVAEEIETGALTGRWQLNKKQSDDPSKVMGERRGGRGGGRSGGPGGGRDGGPGGRGRGSGDSGGPGGEDRPTTLEIVQGADEIVVSDGRGRERTYFTDGRETTVEGLDNEVTESAQWTGEALVVTSRGPRGESTETIRLNADGRLEIIRKHAASGDRPALELRRVYDPVEKQSR